MKRILLFFFLCISIFSCKERPNKRFAIANEGLDSIRLIEKIFKKYKIDSSSAEMNQGFSVFDIKENKYITIKCIYFSYKQLFVAVRCLTQSNIDTTFLIKVPTTSIDSILSTSSSSQTNRDITSLNSFLSVNSNLTIDEKNEIINYVSVISFIYLSRLKTFSREEDIWMKYMIETRNLFSLNSKPSYNLFYNRLMSDSLIVIYPTFEDCERDSMEYVKTRDNINITIRDCKPAITENLLISKRICRDNISYIENDTNSKNSYYFYTVPDFYIFRVSITDSVQFQLITQQRFWKSLFTPESKVFAM